MAQAVDLLRLIPMPIPNEQEAIHVLYADQRPWDLEPYYSRHVAAMTVEELHHKGNIAEQLAVRDKRIAELEQALKVALEGK